MSVDLINGRTVEEIKRNLSYLVRCEICPQNHEYGCDYEKRTKECQTTDDALALIERLEAAVPRWISVKDRLPEKGDNVLISLCGCNVKQAVYRGDGVFEAAYADTYHSTDLGSIVLTHWMPTPKPMEVSE